MEPQFQQTKTPNQKPALSVPVAIIIAGVLIAAAIYFSSSAATLSGTGSARTAPSAESGTAAAPAQGGESAVGEFRPVTADDHIRGSADAKVTVIEYVDLECPFCKRFHPTMQQLIQEYPDDVRWVYRHFPLESLHSKAKAEANAAECAGEQGKFWEFVDVVFEVTPSNDGLSMDDLPKLAQQAGVPNVTQFQSCVESSKYAQHIEEDLADAEAAGGSGTPYSVVIAPNGETFPINGAQPYSAVKQIVDQALGS